MRNTGEVHLSIKNWPSDERPREKLLAHGAGVLSDAELLALFLRAGGRGQSAIELARTLIDSAGGLRPLLRLPWLEAKRLKGLGPARFCELQAAVELGRRQLEAELQRGVSVRDPQALASFLKMQLRDEAVEVFAVVFLDSQLRLLAFEVLSRGGLTHALVSPRQVVERALAQRAHGVVLAHNHPSGVREPSRADLTLTETLRQALALVEVKLHDHLIIADGAPVSLAARGWL